MSTRRLVLLARAGEARERVQAGLAEAGAELAAVCEPGAVGAAALAAEAAQAGALLVLLEPAVEAALEPYESVFADRAIDVVFDDAEVALRREGWEAARWARHLAAKLHGHGDVLPPGRLGEPDPSPVAVPGQSASSAEPAVAVPDWSLAEETVAEPAAPHPAEDSPAEQATFYCDMEAVERRASALSLADAPTTHDIPAGATGGAVLVMAGLGGPDAIRQFLGALPDDFQRAILVRQQLDSGSHDKLVRQLQRTTVLPVSLAEAGEPLAGGRVYVLGDDMGLAASAGGVRFAEDRDDASLPAALHAADSAVILLSGANPRVVDAAMALAGHGGLVAGQSADGCFDPQAAQALIARGGQAGSPIELAQMLAQYWKS